MLANIQLTQGKAFHWSILPVERKNIIVSMVVGLKEGHRVEIFRWPDFRLNIFQRVSPLVHIQSRLTDRDENLTYFV